MRVIQRMYLVAFLLLLQLYRLHRFLLYLLARCAARLAIAFELPIAGLLSFACAAVFVFLSPRGCAAMFLLVSVVEPSLPLSLFLLAGVAGTLHDDGVDARCPPGGC